MAFPGLRLGFAGTCCILYWPPLPGCGPWFCGFSLVAESDCGMLSHLDGSEVDPDGVCCVANGYILWTVGKFGYPRSWRFWKGVGELDAICSLALLMASLISRGMSKPSSLMLFSADVWDFRAISLNFLSAGQMSGDA
ncbi:hypothetical protein Nepgr_022812 [Nepenthes gracilis]|uniref:Uncharacterized protein n=1 Tax=Nepenthes gracilis TaxID=150966 RepID=A0AAD3XYI0_NEPGR|nr:hypothetical protein Nepgr_022812 [Nepenthes gracilis]